MSGYRLVFLVLTTTKGTCVPATAYAEARSKLPAYEVRHKIIELVEHHNVIVISGETGCGKTTQVPQYILEEFEGARIVCTQPRRISAITVANRKIFY